MTSQSDIQDLSSTSAPSTSTAPHASTSSSSQLAPRGILHPLQNYNYTGPAPKAAPSKAQPTIVYVADARALACTGFASDNMQLDESNHTDSMEIQASQPPPQPNANRATALDAFDYSTMRCKRTHSELSKKPGPSEPWVIFHSVSTPDLTYDTFFGTTHDFLDIQTTLQLYPSFVDLPQELRPSKARYEATKANANDGELRVRCLFCRGRFAGINSKAIWERHVKDHWPKEGKYSDEPSAFKILTRPQAHASTSTEAKRPSRHVPRRPSANAHTRHKSNDNGNWRPSVRRERASGDDESSASSSRASSPGPEPSVARPKPLVARQVVPTTSFTIASTAAIPKGKDNRGAVFFPHLPPHQPLDVHIASAVAFVNNPKNTAMDVDIVDSEAPINPVIFSNLPMTPKKDHATFFAPNWEEMFGDSPIRPIGSWNVQMDIEEHQRLSKLPSTDDLLLACIEETARARAKRVKLEAARKSQSDTSSLKKRSRDDESSDDGDDELEPMPFMKRRRVTSFHSVSSFSSYAATSDHDDSSFEFDAADSPVAESPFVDTPGADSPDFLIDEKDL